MSLARLYLPDGGGYRLADEGETIWGWKVANPTGHIVARDHLGNGINVSTVFMFHDHGRGGGTPVLWETLVLEPPREGECWTSGNVLACERYRDRETAAAGHALAVERWRGVEVEEMAP